MKNDYLICPTIVVKMDNYLSLFGILVNHFGFWQNIGFFQACAQGQESCVKLLLDYGALSSAHKTNGFTPLHYAAAGGHVSIVRLLISR